MQCGQKPDGLECESVLTITDGIVREDPNARNYHNGGEADRRLHVIIEDEEARSRRSQLRDCHVIEDGVNGMLEDAEKEVAAYVIAPTNQGWQEVACVLELQQLHQCRRCQVHNATMHQEDALCHHVEDLAGGLPCCHTFEI